MSKKKRAEGAATSHSAEERAKSHARLSELEVTERLYRERIAVTEPPRQERERAATLRIQAEERQKAYEDIVAQLACTMEEEALTACAQNQADLERTKDTSRYHLMRLVRQMRRL